MSRRPRVPPPRFGSSGSGLRRARRPSTHGAVGIGGWRVRLRMMTVRAVAGLEVACDPHRVDADDDRGTDLDGELHADLVTVPQLLELERLPLGEADVRGGPVVPDVGHRVRVVEREASPDLGHGHVWTRCDESAETRCARPLCSTHGSLTPECTP